jgi:hypothetical protein
MSINWLKIADVASITVILAAAGSTVFSTMKTVAGDNVALAAIADTVLNNGGAGLIVGIVVPVATFFTLSNALTRKEVNKDLANGIALISSTAIAITLGGMLYPGNPEIIIATNAIAALCSFAATVYALSGTEPTAAPGGTSGL